MMFGNKPTWLAVFLGNPGPKYEFTRHNAGFITCDVLSKSKGVSVNKLKFKALTAVCELGGESVLLMKPQTYMNNSGEAVGEAARFYKIPPEHVIVVSDEISLPVGRIRIRPKGSAGGHNGLKSIIARLGNDQFIRVKVGVGDRAAGGDLVEHVLGRAKGEDAVKLAEIEERAADTCVTIIIDGVDVAINKYNC